MEITARDNISVKHAKNLKADYLILTNTYHTTLSIIDSKINLYKKQYLGEWENNHSPLKSTPEDKLKKGVEKFFYVEKQLAAYRTTTTNR